jgi:AcrR family transcriptional regulator
MTEVASSQTAGIDKARHTVIKAARQCFARFGVDKTTMEDIAKAANIPRSAVYRFFFSRQEIIESAIRDRVAELSQQLRTVRDNAATFDDALVEVSIATIHVGRHDEEFRNLIDTHSGIQTHDFLAGHNAEIHTYILDFWQQAFDQAREGGQVRATVTDDEIVEWLSSVWMMIIMRTDLTEDAERRMIRNFLLPSVLTRHS